ncbi:dentin sialophosphoprotein-like [Gigantopelta aegis]|uniref:dentin sialophosphoprotein-like n=1 Tax=Gigantopelta aegis TaxID=1735272 RepID=UPI001B8898C8|nr:dentin sialophosphoprotein-like [Gigantopelta aegis]
MPKQNTSLTSGSKVKMPKQNTSLALGSFRLLDYLRSMFCQCVGWLQPKSGKIMWKDTKWKDPNNGSKMSQKDIETNLNEVISQCQKEKKVPPMYEKEVQALDFYLKNGKTSEQVGVLKKEISFRKIHEKMDQVTNMYNFLPKDDQLELSNRLSKEPHLKDAFQKIFLDGLPLRMSSEQRGENQAEAITSGTDDPQSDSDSNAQSSPSNDTDSQPDSGFNTQTSPSDDTDLENYANRSCGPPNSVEINIPNILKPAACTESKRCTSACTGIPIGSSFCQPDPSQIASLSSTSIPSTPHFQTISSSSCRKRNILSSCSTPSSRASSTPSPVKRQRTGSSERMCTPSPSLVSDDLSSNNTDHLSNEMETALSPPSCYNVSSIQDETNIDFSFFDEVIGDEAHSDHPTKDRISDFNSISEECTETDYFNSTSSEENRQDNSSNFTSRPSTETTQDNSSNVNTTPSDQIDIDWLIKLCE